MPTACRAVKTIRWARALYLFTKETGDTFLRIHGTNQPETIGTAVSNGCARLVNDQIIELYDQVPIDTKVVLYPKSTARRRGCDLTPHLLAIFHTHHVEVLYGDSKSPP